MVRLVSVVSVIALLICCSYGAEPSKAAQRMLRETTTATTSATRYDTTPANHRWTSTWRSGVAVATLNCSLNATVTVSATCASLATSYNLTLTDFITINPNLDCAKLQADVVCVQSAELCIPLSLCANESTMALKLAALRSDEYYRSALRYWAAKGYKGSTDHKDHGRTANQTGEGVKAVRLCNTDMSRTTLVTSNSPLVNRTYCGDCWDFDDWCWWTCTLDEDDFKSAAHKTTQSDSNASRSDQSGKERYYRDLCDTCDCDTDPECQTYCLCDLDDE